MLGLLDAMPMADVPPPFADVGSAIYGVVDAKTVEHVVVPDTDIDVPIVEGEPAPASGGIGVPLALVARAIVPPLNAKAMSKAALPLALVDIARAEFVRRLGPSSTLSFRWKLFELLVVLAEHGVQHSWASRCNIVDEERQLFQHGLCLPFVGHHYLSVLVLPLLLGRACAAARRRALRRTAALALAHLSPPSFPAARAGGADPARRSFGLWCTA
mmetsp:Transcript_114014/g.303060  ORF Transcript_114014/g.303060 Transcript_114014/m.303060 type:complete len:215 (-) Transcript_114014:2-646(-)